MPSIRSQNETIKRTREREYLRRWPTVWDQVECDSEHGQGSLHALKDEIRAEHPYVSGTDLENAKNAAVSKINLEWDIRETQSLYEYGGHKFYYRQSAVLKVNGTMAMIGFGAPVPDSIPWVTADNGTVLINKADFMAFAGAMFLHASALAYERNQRITDVDALTTVEDVIAYDVSSGWPGDEA